MSVIDKLLRNRERARLERAVREAPSPGAFLQLAQMLQEDGDLTQARQMAKRGLAAFPQDAELLQLERDLVVLERDAECRRLRDEIARYPNGRLCAHLAELYRAGNEADKALQVVRSGLANYPGHDGLHYVMGLLQADKGAREEACKHLARAAELDKLNYAALKLLGRLLGELGHHAEAAEAFARIRGFAPDDAEVRDLHDRAVRAGGKSPGPAGASAPKSSAPAPAAGPAPGTTPVAPAKPDGGHAAGGPSLVAIALSRLTGRDGIEGAILVDASGQVLNSALPAGQSAATAAAIISDLRRASSPVCGELGLGAFEEATIESAAGGFHVYAIRDLSLGVYAAPRSRAGLIAQHVQTFSRKLQGNELEGAGS